MTCLLLVAGVVVIKYASVVLQQRTSEHPCKALLGTDVEGSAKYAHQLRNILKFLNSTLLRVRNLWLADSLERTLKLIYSGYVDVEVLRCVMSQVPDSTCRRG